MKLAQINEILKDLDNLGTTISTDQSDNYSEEKYPGTEGIKVDIYPTPEKDVFLKVVTACDSYGDNERVKSIQFVAAAEKLVTIFEPIK